MRQVSCYSGDGKQDCEELGREAQGSVDQTCTRMPLNAGEEVMRGEGAAREKEGGKEGLGKGGGEKEGMGVLIGEDTGLAM